MVTVTLQAAAVQTDSGWVQGIENGGLTVFKGIPFAAPPIGELRWRAPIAPQPWSGVRDADRFAPVCMQIGSYPPDAPPEPSSEDCLYLNIWVPANTPPPDKSGGGLPVMVWIFGGGLLSGSASTPLYAGDELASRGVILVTASYRLGVLGFLAHPELSRESARHVSGNYGLLDQIAALSWVQRNIAAFGGDPHRVTVFGQSSGSISISVLTSSSLARGLFQRAIGESGGLFEPVKLMSDFKLAGAEQTGLAFAAASGATSLAQLRAKAAADLLKTRFIPHAVIDGYLLTESPYETYRAGRQNPVDLLIGSNAEEGRYFLPQQSITADNLHALLSEDFPSAIVRLVGPSRPDGDAAARAAFIDFEGQMRFGWDMWAWARVSRGPVYLYRFAGVQSDGASHGAEMPYVFGHGGTDPVLTAAVPAYWTQFAKTGDPNQPGLPHWPAFTDADPRVLRLGDPITVQPIPDLNELRAIDRLYRLARWIERWY